MTGHKICNEKDEETLKNESHEAKQLQSKFQKHSQAFLNMVTEFEKIWNGYNWRINVS